MEYHAGSFCGQLVEEMLPEAPELCLHSFAHHVMESVVENGLDQHRSYVAKTLLQDLWTYATHKNSSYLLEKALTYCGPSEQEALISQLGRPEMILDLAQTQYGCYVARALLRDYRVSREAAMDLIIRYQSRLEATAHGKRFLADVGLAPAHT